MAVTGTLDFLETTMDKTREWLSDLNRELSWDDFAQSYQALRAVLHALRDRLPVEEAADLAAQLPMLIRGMFYEGWRPAGKPVKMRSVEEFLDHVEEGLGPNPPTDARRITRAVFALLNARITAGEISDVRGNLPDHIRELWPA